MAQQHYPAAPESSGSETAWVIIGSVVIGLLVICGGLGALVGVSLLAETDDDSNASRMPSPSETSSHSSTASPTPKGGGHRSGKPSPAGPAGELANNTPSTVVPGRAFTHDAFEAAPGWRVVDEAYMGPSIEGLSVTNRGGDRRTAFLTFRFYRGTTVLAEVECSSHQMQARESSPMDCFSFDEFPAGYDAVKVSDAW